MNDPATRLGFADGFRSLPRAAGILFRAPRILLWLIPPLLITLFLDALAFYFIFGWIRDGIDMLLPEEGWLGWLATALDVVGAGVVVVLLGWSFTWLFLTLTSPFHDHISAAVEHETRGSAGPEPEGLHGFFKSIFLGALQAAVLLLLTLLLLLLNLVPVIGSVLFFLWSTFALGYSFVSIPSGRMADPFAKRLSFARQHHHAVMGLGLAVFLASLAPILNLLFMPVFVVAGTLLHLDATEPDPR